MKTWNGKSLLPQPCWKSDSARCVEVHTDACTAGYGAVHGEQLFAATWTDAEETSSQRNMRDSMPRKELDAIVVAAATWGSSLGGMHVRLHSDCQPIVMAWKKGDSAEPGVAELMRSLLFLCAHHDFLLTVEHIAGTDNVCADLLSRGQIQAFKGLLQPHSPSPVTPLPVPTLSW